MLTRDKELANKVESLEAEVGKLDGTLGTIMLEAVDQEAWAHAALYSAARRKIEAAQQELYDAATILDPDRSSAEEYDGEPADLMRQTFTD